MNNMKFLSLILASAVIVVNSALAQIEPPVLPCQAEIEVSLSQLQATCDKYQKPDESLIAVWEALDPASIPADFQSSNARINTICNPYRGYQFEAGNCDPVYIATEKNRLLGAKAGIQFVLVAAILADAPVPTGSMLCAQTEIIPRIEALKAALGIAQDAAAALQQENETLRVELSSVSQTLALLQQQNAALKRKVALLRAAIDAIAYQFSILPRRIQLSLEALYRAILAAQQVSRKGGD